MLGCVDNFLPRQIDRLDEVDWAGSRNSVTWCGEHARVESVHAVEWEEEEGFTPS